MTERVRKGLSTSDLKWIAIITMLVDHIGAAVFIIYTTRYDGTADFARADLIYQMIRNIGRTAFPVFCFLLVEGFYHTHDIKKYLIRLGLFCFLSEVPFDLAFTNQWKDMTHQNVFWTLFLGMLAIYAMHQLEQQSLKVTYQGIFFILLKAAKYFSAVFFVVIAELLETDYGAAGVSLILVLYLMRDKRIWQCLLGYLCFCWEAWSFPGFVFIWFYDGRKGMKLKYFFYLFYPCHLILLYMLRLYLLKGRY